MIVGPNACGKSTLLRALARLITPDEGQVVLDGKLIGTLPAREVARRLGLLPQSSTAPDGITVADLVARADIRIRASCGNGRGKTSVSWPTP